MNKQENTFSFLIMFIFLITGVERIASQSIIIDNYKPYNYEENGEVYGFSVDIVRAIMQELQISVPFQKYPSRQVHKMAQENTHKFIRNI